MIRVEFYGVPRARTGVAAADIEQAETLGDLLRDLSRRFPDLTKDCVVDQRLSPHCKANLDGSQFVSDPRTSLVGVRSVLILSADAGG